WKDALETFQAEVLIHPKSGRALYGMLRALQELKKLNEPGADKAAEQFEKEFYDAWEVADYRMTDAALWPANDYHVPCLWH
ncbi:MAG: hypothetical protein ACRD3J_12660, partial [Thermoanaerobaculia bacterium]